MYLTSSTNTHHDVTTFEVDKLIQNIKNEYLENGTFFHNIKKILVPERQHFHKLSLFWGLTFKEIRAIWCHLFNFKNTHG